MSDEKKLKEIFDFNSDETKKLLQKAKVITLLRTVAVSLFVFLLLSIAIVIINTVVLNRIAMKKLTSEQNFDLVARPNIYMSQYQFNDGFLTGELEYVTHRIVGNRPVYNGTYKIKYSIIPIVPGIYGPSARGQLIQVEDKGDYSHYNRVGNREMKFYHPYIEYKTYQNDLALLEEIGEDKYLEMALSFDRDYSLEEVQAMLPDEVKPVWYWVNTYNEEDLNELKKGEIILFANQVYGMKGVNSDGTIIKDPRLSFISAVNFGLKQKSRYHSQFQRLYQNLSNDKGEITKDNIRVIGVVVTGDTASMKLLRDKTYIKAATLGIVIDKF
ncbi:MAG: anti-sigma factor [Thermosediminibacteraceae bacterium]|nr:anti-sigma factor [Thermosediminibacteraceae bacterium]